MKDGTNLTIYPNEYQVISIWNNKIQIRSVIFGLVRLSYQYIRA